MPADLKREGDRQAHELIMAALTAARPDDAVLSEEGKDDPARLAAERVWIVDPLDGTREYSEPPRADWAVHVALVVGGDAGGRRRRPSRRRPHARHAPTRRHRRPSPTARPAWS